MNIPINPFVYRGKSLEVLNKGQYVKGDKYEDQGKVYIKPRESAHSFEIDPSTLGISWGMKDRSGKDVFTGDVAKLKHHTALYVCKWHEGQYAFGWKCLVTNEWRCMENESEIIGNIYDDPELVED